MPNLDTSGMFEKFPWGEIKQMLHLYLASEHARKGRMPGARKRMNLALASTPQPVTFLLAYDGLLMIGEDRHQDARARFAECLEASKQGECADDDYVARYCEFWLAIYDENVGWEGIKSAAEKKNVAWSNASKIVQIYLPRSSLSLVEQNCGHRQSASPYDWSRVSPSQILRTSIDFDL